MKAGVFSIGAVPLDRNEAGNGAAGTRRSIVVGNPTRDEPACDAWRSSPANMSVDPEDLRRFWESFRYDAAARARLEEQVLARHPDPAAVASHELPDVLMLLELLIINRDYATCRAYAERLTLRYPADLRLQDVRARCVLLQTDDSPLVASPEYAWKPFAGRFCPSPFRSLCFFEHGAYVCCCNFQPTVIGPIAANSGDELWNSPVAQHIRRTILDGSFRYCNKMVCPRLRNGELPLRTDPALSAKHKKIIAEDITSSPGCRPETIELDEDPSCNLMCPSCRTGPVQRDTQFLQKFEATVLPGVLAGPLESLLVACYGDPFASAHYLRVLRSLSPDKHQLDMLVLYTNAVLFTPDRWEELSNLRGFRIEVRVSIDAACRETYAEVRPALNGVDYWDQLNANLDFLAGLRRDGRIALLKLMFVVQHKNYREMPAFVRMAVRRSADEVVFAELQKYGAYDGNDELYARNAIHLATHPEHVRFREVLADAMLAEPIVSLHGCKLQPSK